MRLINKDNQLTIETYAYQARNGGLYLNWGNMAIPLEKGYAERIAYDIPDFNLDNYKDYYQLN